MTVKKRPRGRGLALAGTLLLAVGLGAGSAQAEVQAFAADVGYPREITPGPDGALWVAGVDGAQTRVARITTAGQSETVRIGGTHGEPSTRMVAQADGGVAFLVPSSGRHDARQVLVALRHEAVQYKRTLPSSVDVRGAVAVGPDRSVWFAAACDDVLGRVTPQGRVVRHRLARMGCMHVGDRTGVEQSSTIRLGSDGSVWLVNRCQGRIARLQRSGRIAEWRLRPLCDAGDTGAERPSRALAEPNGGLRVERARVTSSGDLRVGAGIRVPDLVAADGGEWWAEPGASEVVLRTAGVEQRVVVTEPGGSIVNATAAAGGGIAVLVARPRPGLPDHPAPEILFVNGDQVRAHTELFPGIWSLSIRTMAMAAGPDGALWATDSDYQALETRQTLLRVPDLAHPARPRATLARVLGRDGRRLWLQVACSAPPGVLCNGRLALARRGGGSLLRTSPRYVAAGGMPVTVSGVLTRAARRALRRGRALPVRATVTAHGTTTHRNLEISR